MDSKIEPELVAKVLGLGRFDSEEAAVNAALREYIARHATPGQYLGNPQDIIDLFGTIDFDPDYDYKEARRRDLKRIPKDDDC
jgi:hypothetical protein